MNQNKIEITNKKLEELRHLAQAATPGPWNQHPNSPLIVVDAGTLDAICEVHTHPLIDQNSNANAMYIAAASPDFILALIEDYMQLLLDNRRLFVEVDKLEKMVDWFAAKMPLSKHDDNRQEGINRWKRDARNMTR